MDTVHGATAVNLNTAANFAGISSGEMFTSNNALSVGGNLAASSYSSHFHFGISGEYIAGTQYTYPQSQATTALADANTAYTSGNSQACTFTFVSGTTSVPITLAPGVYCFTNLVLNAPLKLQGASGSVWIFKITGGLTTNTNNIIEMTGGANICNVYWTVSGSVTIQGTFPFWLGWLLAQGSISITGGGSGSGLFALSGTLTLDVATSADNNLGCVASSANPSVSQVALSTAAYYAVLAASGYVDNTGNTLVNGNMWADGQLSGQYYTGFPPGVDIGFMETPFYQYGIDSRYLDQTDAEAAYNSAFAETCTTMFTASTVGTQTLSPGVYCFLSYAVTISGTITLNSAAGAGAVWIFQGLGAITFASSSIVQVTGGANTCQVFWMATTSITISTNANVVGTIFAGTGNIQAQSGSITTGSLMVFTGNVLMTSASVDVSACRPIDPIVTTTMILANTATTYGIIAGGGSIDCTTGTSTCQVQGDLAATSFINFAPAYESGIEVFSGSQEYNEAVSDATTAYHTANSRKCTTVLESGTTITETLGPGVYCWLPSTTNVQLTGTLALSGPAGSAWIFQVPQQLTVSGASMEMTLSGGVGNACGIIWTVGSSASFTAGEVIFQGSVIAQGSITSSGNDEFSGQLVSLTSSVAIATTQVRTSSCQNTPATTLPAGFIGTGYGTLFAALSATFIETNATVGNGASTLKGYTGTYPVASGGTGPGHGYFGFPPSTVTNGQMFSPVNNLASEKTAFKDIQYAYTFATQTTCGANYNNIPTGVLSPGLYCFFDSNVILTGELTLRGALGDAFILYAPTTLTFSANSFVNLVGGVTGCSVMWVSAGNIVIGASATIAGSLIAHTTIVSSGPGATVTGGGGLFTMTSFISLNANIIDSTQCLSPSQQAPSLLSTTSSALVADTTITCVTGVHTCSVTGDAVALTSYTGFGSGDITGLQTSSSFNDAVATIIMAEVITAYNFLAIQSCDVTFSTANQNVARGMYFIPGVYCWQTANVNFLGSTITLNGPVGSVFIFVATAGQMLLQTSVILTGGVTPCTVFFIANTVHLNNDIIIYGNIIADGNIASSTVVESSSTLSPGQFIYGRVISLAGSIVLHDATVNIASCQIPTVSTNAVPLGTTHSFAIVAAGNIAYVTGASSITGDMAAMTPGTNAYIEFPQPTASTGLMLSSHNLPSIGNQVLSDATAAFTSALSQPCGFNFSYGATIASVVLAPGVYCWSPNAITGISSGTISGAIFNGPASGVWIFKGSSTTNLPGTITLQSMSMGGLASPCNVFYAANTVTVAQFSSAIGTLMSRASVPYGILGIAGRAFSIRGNISLSSTIINSHEFICDIIPSSISLQFAGPYAIVAATNIINSGSTTQIIGDTAAMQGYSGFSPGMIIGFANSNSINSISATQAILNATSALSTALSAICETILTPSQTINPIFTTGVYCFQSSTPILSGSITFIGTQDAVWIFQFPTSLSSLSFASNSVVTIIGGGSMCNIFWASASPILIETGAQVQGIRACRP